MKLILLFSIFLLMPTIFWAQETKFKVLPFVDGITSIKDGLIEAGPEFHWEKVAKGKTFTLRPTLRMPMPSKTENNLQIDRFSSTWRGILTIQYTLDNTSESSKISIFSFSGHFEYGVGSYKYYPTGNKSNEQKTAESSYALELKCIGFFSKGDSGAKQISPQFRLRYSYDWKASNEVGVVNPPNVNGVVTTASMIIDAPSVTPTFSPAFSLQYYSGKGNFSYSPTIYYDFTGGKGANNPFNNLNRLRLEFWVFFYPVIKDNPNIKIGISPSLSLRTAGTDDFNKVEYGGMITLRFGTTFLQFL